MSKPATQESMETARRQLIDGAVAQAIDTLSQLVAASRIDHAALQQIAELYLQCGQYESARGCYQRSVELQPANPGYLFNLAASVTAFGDFEKADALYARAIEFDPGDCGAWLNRCGLRRATADRNHVAEMNAVKSRLGESDPGHIPLCYGLAKELEDLGQYAESFTCLQEGSHRRRLGMQYDIMRDEAAMSAIARHFDGTMLGKNSGAPVSNRPVFILGLPRSGSTLLERIISAHSQVGSLGEHNMLPFVLMKQAGVTPEQALDRSDLIARSAKIDFSRAGHRYLEAIDGFGDPAPRLIDKTPPNFLYLGLIHLCLPGARIIHMRRSPLDACYAIYKTLFRAGYPFSYSLQELGRYYIAYTRLMDHWRQQIPGAFIDVDYESLVADPEAETRQVLDYLELEWEDGCREFHRAGGAAATASAAQVRQPIYSRSVNLWRRYEKQLAPFAARLREHGIDIEDAA